MMDETSPAPPPTRTPAPAPAPDASDAVFKPSPSFVELLLQQILVERDLDAAQKMLVDALAPALGQHENTPWTARIYALLSAVAALGGQDSQALRLAVRAVTLDDKVALEPQLGDIPLKVLKQAREIVKGRPKNAALEAESLPIGLELWVDGRPLELPGHLDLIPGDHLLQVVANTGVIAHQWVTFEVGSTLQEPPPLPEVRASIRPIEKSPPLPPEELEALTQQANRALGMIGELASALEVEQVAAREGRHMARATCLVDVEKGFQHIQEETEGYQQRLALALEKQNPDELRHLFNMFQLARDEALHLKVEQEACLDTPLPDVPMEVRVVEKPAGAPSSPLGLRMPPQTPRILSDSPDGLPELSARRPIPGPLSLVLPFEARPVPFQPTASTQKTATGETNGGGNAANTGKKPANPAVMNAEVQIDGLFEDNPDRVASKPVDVLALSGASRTLLGVQVTPLLNVRKETEGLRSEARLRLPLLVFPGTAEPTRLLDGELLATLEGRSPVIPTNATDGSLLTETVPPWRAQLWMGQDHFAAGELSSSFGRLERQHLQLSGSKTGTATSSVTLQLNGQGLLEHYAFPDVPPLAESAEDTDVETSDALRFGGSVDARSSWQIFPLSLLEARAGVAIAHMHPMNLQAAHVLLAGHRTSLEPHLLVGTRAMLLNQSQRHVWLDARAGVGGAQVLTDQLESPPLDWLPQGTLGLSALWRFANEQGASESSLTLSLAAEQSLSSAVFADATRFAGLTLSGRLHLPALDFGVKAYGGTRGSFIAQGSDAFEEIPYQQEILSGLRTQQVFGGVGELNVRLGEQRPLWAHLRYELEHRSGDMMGLGLAVGEVTDAQFLTQQVRGGLTLRY